MSQGSQFRLLQQRRFLPFFGAQAFGAFNDNVYKNVLVIVATYHAADYTKLEPELRGIYGIIFWEPLDGDAPGARRQRNVTVFADGEVDRSPCGSGTCARLAVLATEGRLGAGAVLRHDSIVGSTFTGTVLDTVDVDGRAAVVPQVTGTAYRTGEHVFSVDPDDPLVPGFVLR